MLLFRHLVHEMDGLDHWMFTLMCFPHGGIGLVGHFSVFAFTVCHIKDSDRPIFNVLT